MSTSHLFSISCQLGFEELVKQELLHILCAYHPDLESQAQTSLPKAFKFADKKHRKDIEQELMAKHKITLSPGAVSCNLELDQAIDVMHWTRVGSRLLLVLGNFHVESDIELYNAIYNYNWRSLLRDGFEFMVNFHGTSPELKNSHYSALRVKDALCDYYTNYNQERPNVNTDEPDVILDCRLHRGNLQLSIDLCGSLHKRYRQRAGSAPMRETLAANLLLRSGWDKESPVYNPMCGSGVLAIEAAMIALNVAPGLYLSQYHFDYLRDYDGNIMLERRNFAQNSRLAPSQVPQFHVYASDNDRAVLLVAEQNAYKCEVEEVISFAYQDFTALARQEQHPTGLVIINPPYGVRLVDPRLQELYYNIGQLCRQLFSGWIVAVISSSKQLLNAIGLKVQRSWKIANSNLDCIYNTYVMHAANDSVSAPKKAKPKTNCTFDDDSVSQVLDSGSDQQDVVAQQPVTANLDLIDDDARGFYNRLVKNAKRLKSYLKRKDVTSYRLYDADIPDFNFSVDHYRDVKKQRSYFIIQEYAAPKNIPLHKTIRRSLQAMQMLEDYVASLNEKHPVEIIDKRRERQKGDAQYTKLGDTSLEIEVAEYDLLFKANLSDYIDTGIFLDNRDLRYYLRSLLNPNDKFLNLFCYTGTATAHAARAGALTTSVDMSAKYCEWAGDNLQANLHTKNRHELAKHKIIQADVVAWLSDRVQAQDVSYDLVFCDPPTFSNSKRMEGTFDVQRDHVVLLTQISQLLTTHGKIVFCNNKRNFKLDTAALQALNLKITDITKATMPEDFKDSKIHQAWLLERH